RLPPRGSNCPDHRGSRPGDLLLLRRNHPRKPRSRHRANESPPHRIAERSLQAHVVAPFPPNSVYGRSTAAPQVRKIVPETPPFFCVLPLTNPQIVVNSSKSFF